MKYDIKVTKTRHSKLSEVDFSNIPFGKVFSDHMFSADYRNGVWTNFEILPYGPITFYPSLLSLHYGQSIFEGMKGSKDINGNALLFRPEMHAKRFNISAERMCMPNIPESLFLEALHRVIDLDKDWIPPLEGSALYIRPFMFATDEEIGVKISDNYRFMIFTGPVGPYYPKPISLKAETKYVRAVRGGVGEAKAAGNYGGALLPAKLAKAEGYDQVLWLDGLDFKNVQEVGTMNLFFVIDGTVITPETDGAILKGITRDSFITILREKGIPFEVRKLTIDEIVDAHKAGVLEEIFGAGTAAVVANVSELKYKDYRMFLPPVEDHRIAAMLKSEINGIRMGIKEDKFNWMVPVVSEMSPVG